MKDGRTQAASVIFVNGRGELLLRLRGSQHGLPYPGMWDLIGGGMEGGESHAEAIVRETEEELCLLLTGQVYWRVIEGDVPIHVYAARLEAAAQELTLTEGDRVDWFSPEEALRLTLVPYMQTLLPAFAASALYAAMIRPDWKSGRPAP